MVGVLLDGRECGFAANAFAEDVAHFLAREGQPTHLFLLVPTPVQAPRLLHTVRRPDRPAARLESISSVETLQTPLDDRSLGVAVAALAQQLEPQVTAHRLTALHAIGLDLSAQVARALHAHTGLPYFVTPRHPDLNRGDAAFRARAGAALRSAHSLLVFDGTTPRLVQERFGVLPPRVDVLARGVDLDTFRPLPRPKRMKQAEMLLGRRELRGRLEGLDWLQSFVVLAVESREDRHGFEQLLFALPELLRLQPALQVVAVGAGDPLTDGLRAALAAGRAELLHDVVATSELCQPLVDHLERLQLEHRAEDWWRVAARIEPERRVRFVGRVTRTEFAALLRLSDVFVMPGTASRPPSQMLFEALACGVLPLASDQAGIDAVARLVSEGISPEIGRLCVLRGEAPPVRELEEKIGRLARLRPELGEPLRALATAGFDGGRAATDLRRVYAEFAPAPA